MQEDRLEPDVENLEQEKKRLEIALLRRDLGKSHFSVAFIDKWMPSIIAAVILFTLVPLANFILWKNQKAIEIYNLHLSKKMDIYSETASNATQFAQMISQLNQLYKVRKGELPANPSLTITPDKKRASELILELEKARPTVESRLIKSLRDVKLYFGSDASQQVDVIRNFYNNYEKDFDDKFVQSFLGQYYKLSEMLESEIRRDLNKSN